MGLAPEPTAPEPDRPPVLVTAVVDGRPYPLRPRELNSIDIGALRKEARTTLRSLVSDIYLDDAAIDTIAQIVWLSRRGDGENWLTYEAVAVDITQAGLEDGRYDLVFPERDEDATPAEPGDPGPEVVLDPPV